MDPLVSSEDATICRVHGNAFGLTWDLKLMCDGSPLADIPRQGRSLHGATVTFWPIQADA